MRGGPVTQNTTNLITVSLLPVAILMIGYALTTYILRSSYLRRKQVQPHKLPQLWQSTAAIIAGTPGLFGYT